MSGFSWTVVRVILAVALLGWRWMPRELTPPGLDRVRWALGCDEVEKLQSLLSKEGPDRQDQGYYNQLLDAGVDTSSVPICQTVDELRAVILRPNLSIVRADGTTWSTNALGMRDQPYAPSKPARTFRIAMTGDSIGVALGVSDGRGFEPVLEEWLEDQSQARGGPDVEIHNFALPGRSPGQRWDHFQKIGWSAEPDLVVFEATPADIGWDHRRLVPLLAQGIGWNSPLYRDVVTRAGVSQGASIEEYSRALWPHRWQLLEAAYRAVAAECRERGIPCLWVLIPRVGRTVAPPEHRRLVDTARAAGFTEVLDLSDSFDGFDPAALAIHPSDFHPNAQGHAVLASRLAEALWPLPAMGPLREPGPVSPDEG